MRRQAAIGVERKGWKREHAARDVERPEKRLQVGHSGREASLVRDDHERRTTMALGELGLHQRPRGPHHS